MKMQHSAEWSNQFYWSRWFKHTNTTAFWHNSRKSMGASSLNT